MTEARRRHQEQRVRMLAAAGDLNGTAVVEKMLNHRDQGADDTGWDTDQFDRWLLGVMRDAAKWRGRIPDHTCGRTGDTCGLHSAAGGCLSCGARLARTGNGWTVESMARSFAQIRVHGIAGDGIDPEPQDIELVERVFAIASSVSEVNVAGQGGCRLAPPRVRG